MKTLGIILFITCAGCASGQRLPVPEDCPKTIEFMYEKLGPDVQDFSPCRGNSYDSDLDFYKLDRAKASDTWGHEGVQLTFRQFGPHFTNVISIFYYTGREKMNIHETYLNRASKIDEDFKNRGAKRLGGFYREFDGHPRDVAIFRDGLSKVFLLLEVDDQSIIEQQVRITCDKCEEDAIGFKFIGNWTPAIHPVAVISKPCN